ncbi:MAG: LamG-like jellyroll fold domain-containing protein, partial [Nanoarchaeota archaeon]
FVIKAKVKPSISDTSGTNTILSRPTATCYKPQFSIDTYRREYRVRVSTSNTMTYTASGGTVIAETWQKIIAIMNDNMLYLYVDGEKVAETSVSGTPSASSESLFIGQSNPECDSTFDFTGYLEYVEIYGK